MKADRDTEHCAHGEINEPSVNRRWISYDKTVTVAGNILRDSELLRTCRLFTSLLLAVSSPSARA